MNSQAERHFLLDLGSRTAKAYRYDGTLTEMHTLTWEILEDRILENQIPNTLKVLVAPFKAEPDVRISAFGTEAMRRKPELASVIATICKKMGIKYRTLTQYEEAKLIIQAAQHSGENDIVNVGGGSIQIVSPHTRQMTLLGFGISDLNQMFNLTDNPSRRKIDDCVAFVKDHLPSLSHTFVYTGGEMRYLRHFGVTVKQGVCLRTDFGSFASMTAKQPLENLMANSPYDPKWMRGAIASNCVVLALIERTDADHFIASDLNIANGIARGFAARDFHRIV